MTRIGFVGLGRMGRPMAMNLVRHGVDVGLEPRRERRGIRQGGILAGRESGVDPRGSAQIPQGILEAEILLKMRFELDQYINLRPTRLLPGVPTPLASGSPGYS